MIAGVSRGAALLAVFCTLLGQPRPPVRVFIGDSAHPVVSGEVWLVAHEWGYYPAVLVATIRNGSLEQVREPEPIKGAEHASEYKLLVAISDRPLRPRDLRRTDDAYGVAQPAFIKEFAYLYLSDPLSNEQQGRDWPAALNRMGVTADGQFLTLPRPGPRLVRLLYPDGRPFAGAGMTVSLFGSNYNHCGAPIGIPVGTYRTDPRGRIVLTAPPGPLALSQPYYELRTAGPAGRSFVLKGHVVTGGEAVITLRKWWKPPRRSYVLSLRRSSGQPLRGARLSGCLRNEVCGAVCGPIPAAGAVSNQSGILRFEAPDLRSMESLRITNAAGQERAMSESELRQLMTTHRLLFTWR